MEDTSKWINTINRERVQERKIHISFLYRLSRVFPCTIWGNLELTWNAGSTLFPQSKALGRSVVFPFRYAQEGGSRTASGAGLGKFFQYLGARKCHYPCFPGGSFINQSMKKRSVFSNFVVYLSTFGNTDISVYQCIINCNCFYRKRVRHLPLRRENSETTLSISTFLCMCSDISVY